MRKTLLAGLCLAIALTGCRAKELAEKAAITRDLEKRGTLDLAKQVADDKYTPPADGKLTDSQVQMYLKVRDHEKQIAQVAKQQAQQHADAAKKAGEKSLSGLMEGFKTMGSVADMMTADIRAAKDLGYNTQEYLWVKGQILAVSTAAMGEKMGEAMNAGMEKAYNEAKKGYEEAKDEQTKAMYKQTMDAFEQQRNQMKANEAKQDPAVAYNKQLVSKYEDALNAYTAELSKWEDKPGDAQKSVKDFEQNVQKAKADANKGQ
ncbi:MAG TPA: hypothetical protein VLU46_16020 [Thermoanaerobaculia bacterium]|nr:hypothetical protein [Thermoanaerobaculia bacterium]